jgi:hypothetical protein
MLDTQKCGERERERERERENTMKTNKKYNAVGKI